MAYGSISISSLPPGYGKNVVYEVTARHDNVRLLVERVSACVSRGTLESGIHGVTLDVRNILK
jgi:hypothetical protein